MLDQIEKRFIKQKFLDAIRNLQPPLSLFKPLYLVLNFCMNIFSRCFLNFGSWLKIFSIIEISMSLEQCPFWLKCAPVDFEVFWLLTYPLCSKNLSRSFLSLSPIYCWGHLLNPSKYIILLLEQSTLEFMSTLNFVAVA